MLRPPYVRDLVPASARKLTNGAKITRGIPDHSPPNCGDPFLNQAINHLVTQKQFDRKDERRGKR
jgi:hypothetical protein